MSKQFKTSCALVLAIGLLVACNKDADAGKAQNTAASFDALDGLWKQACRAIGTGGSAVYTQTTLEINGLESSYLVDTFTTPGCTSERVSSNRMTFSFGLGGAAVGIVNARNLDIITSRILYTPRSELIANAYNATAYCGVTNWRVDVEQDVAGRTCDSSQVAKPGTPSYGVISIGPGAFYLGKTATGGTGFAAQPFDRPTDLDAEPFVQQ